jgi:hypothetical protein
MGGQRRYVSLQDRDGELNDSEYRVLDFGAEWSAKVGGVGWRPPSPLHRLAGRRRRCCCFFLLLAHGCWCAGRVLSRKRLSAMPLSFMLMLALHPGMLLGSTARSLHTTKMACHHHCFTPPTTTILRPPHTHTHTHTTGKESSSSSSIVAPAVAGRIRRRRRTKEHKHLPSSLPLLLPFLRPLHIHFVNLKLFLP